MLLLKRKLTGTILYSHFPIQIGLLYSLCIKLAYICIAFYVAVVFFNIMHGHCASNTFFRGPPSVKRQTQYSCALLITVFPVDNSCFKPLFKILWCLPYSGETLSTYLLIMPWPLPLRHSFLLYQKGSLLFIVSFQLSPWVGYTFLNLTWQDRFNRLLPSMYILYILC